MNVSALTATLLLLLKCPVRPLCLYACSREPPKRQNAHGRRQPTPCLSINWYSAPSAKSLGWLVEFTGWELAAAFFNAWQGPCKCILSSSTHGLLANTRARGTLVLFGASFSHFPQRPGLTQTGNNFMDETHCPIKLWCFPSAGIMQPSSWCSLPATTQEGEGRRDLLKLIHQEAVGCHPHSHPLPTLSSDIISDSKNITVFSLTFRWHLILHAIVSLITPESQWFGRHSFPWDLARVSHFHRRIVCFPYA